MTKQENMCSGREVRYKVWYIFANDARLPPDRDVLPEKGNEERK